MSIQILHFSFFPVVAFVLIFFFLDDRFSILDLITSDPDFNDEEGEDTNFFVRLIFFSFALGTYHFSNTFFNVSSVKSNNFNGTNQLFLSLSHLAPIFFTVSFSA